ncbi:MAG: hypothetical protein QMD36_00785 [Candidatus Aenigmarchaeota archaeon]|nr:hypothetical protein [Candidatus Aenigmarchaeota archaeon]
MKGQLFTLESLISILMLLFIVVYLFQNPPTSPEFRRINYKLKAYNGLKILEETGELRKDAVDDNSTRACESIKTKLDPFIPDFLNETYRVVLFDETGNITEIPSLASENNMLSVSYLLVGDIGDYKPREVRVYIWGFE